MAELLAKSPCAGLLPLTIGATSLRALDVAAITSVAPFAGQEQPVSEALKAQIGAGFPKPGRSTGKSGARVVWSGQGQAFVLGAPLEPIPGAALSDQSDAWAAVVLEGDGAAVRDVLARLTPIDLRESVFKQGHAARTELAHMSALLIRLAAARYAILVFRSMAKTLVHDVNEAMTSVAGRAKADR